jgi:hypothetical protein
MFKIFNRETKLTLILGVFMLSNCYANSYVSAKDDRIIMIEIKKQSGKLPIAQVKLWEPKGGGLSRLTYEGKKGAEADLLSMKDMENFFLSKAETIDPTYKEVVKENASLMHKLIEAYEKMITIDKGGSIIYGKNLLKKELI